MYLDDAIESVPNAKWGPTHRSTELSLWRSLISIWHHCPFPEKEGSLQKFYQTLLSVVFCTQAIISLPDRDFYVPCVMFSTTKAASDKWYGELYLSFQSLALFDPFEQMTNASACNRFLRMHCQEPYTLATIPLTGCAGGLWMAGVDGTQFGAGRGGTHGGNDSEVRIPAHVKRSTGSTRLLTKSTSLTDASGTWALTVRLNVLRRTRGWPTGACRTSMPYVRQSSGRCAPLFIAWLALGSVFGTVRRTLVLPYVPSLDRRDFPSPLDPRDVFFIGRRSNAYCLIAKQAMGEKPRYYDYWTITGRINIAPISFVISSSWRHRLPPTLACEMHRVVSSPTVSSRVVLPLRQQIELSSLQVLRGTIHRESIASPIAFYSSRRRHRCASTPITKCTNFYKIKLDCSPRGSSSKRRPGPRIPLNLVPWAFLSRRKGGQAKTLASADHVIFNPEKLGAINKHIIMHTIEARIRSKISTSISRYQNISSLIITPLVVSHSLH